ncbi:hypothetical protein LDFHOB_09910 [Candidatus Electronema aureum]|jgi:hypothetical protein
MNALKMSLVLLLAACLFSGCTVYHQEAPRKSSAPSNSPEQKAY